MQGWAKAGYEVVFLNTPNSVIRNELGFVWQKAENENVHCAFTEFGHWYIVQCKHYARFISIYVPSMQFSSIV